MGCNKCYFRAEREPGTTGASGRMSYYTPTPSSRRSVVDIKYQAEKYTGAKSRAEAEQIQKQHGLRWSELTYFDLSRMITIDPMHTLSNEAINPCALSGSKRTELFRRIKTLNVPYDIGRLPSNMKEKNSLSGLTAEQMKKFAIVYARACLQICQHNPLSFWAILFVLSNKLNFKDIPRNPIIPMLTGSVISFS